VCDHQYTIHSTPVQYFVAGLASLSDAEKSKFVRFLTGSPKLPIGGFKSLQPRLTVVRKETDGDPDGYLPSVMTCVNYVKLPRYSSLELTTQRIRQAISEGQGSFHLS
jgi:E3 ubiquitin-protein ligase TRIP12